jgi:hypothetical protein
MTRATRGLLLILSLAALSACSYTFIPLTPRPLELPPAILINAGSVLTRSQDRIVLRVTLDQVPSEGYLSASLYRDDERISEDSKLIDATAANLEFDLSEARIGQYRAYLFWQGAIVRQFEFALE